MTRKQFTRRMKNASNRFFKAYLELALLPLLDNTQFGKRPSVKAARNQRINRELETLLYLIDRRLSEEPTP